MFTEKRTTNSVSLSPGTTSIRSRICAWAIDQHQKKHSAVNQRHIDTTRKNLSISSNNCYFEWNSPEMAKYHRLNDSDSSLRILIRLLEKRTFIPRSRLMVVGNLNRATQSASIPGINSMLSRACRWSQEVYGIHSSNNPSIRRYGGWRD